MSALTNEIIPEYVQGSSEWHAFRKTKITATDAAVILGLSPWKTRLQLYYEKLSDEPPKPPTPAQQRGLDLEPLARDLFNLKTGWNMQPTVFTKEWAMASLDGQDPDIGAILEIKCPGEKDHALALEGKVPEHYYPQLQHQMYVVGVQMMYYFSFDGFDGVIVKVKRDDDFIDKMIIEELKFYNLLQNKTPPEPTEKDYTQRNDDIWHQCAGKYLAVTSTLKQLEKEQSELRDQLIFLAGGSNAKGAGISLCKVIRKGNIVYANVPQLIGVDLEPHRGPSITSWRIS